MRSGWRRRLLLSASLVLLAALGTALVAEALEHTDDGCAVETHCVACNWQRGATVVPTIVAMPVAPVELGRTLERTVAPSPSDGASLETPSRAPPPA
jgi:hypothetical protein